MAWSGSNPALDGRATSTALNRSTAWPALVWSLHRSRRHTPRERQLPNTEKLV